MNFTSSKYENLSSSILSFIIKTLIGSLIIALSAQVSFFLPFTPIPVTGQTFGIFLVALSLGSKQGTAAVLTYLLEGTLGLPVFASGGSILNLVGPSGGYLYGAIPAVLCTGYFADKGCSSSYIKTFSSILAANVFLYSFGLIHLSFFVPSDKLLLTGLIPFIPGDIFKIVLLSIFIPSTKKFFQLFSNQK